MTTNENEKMINMITERNNTLQICYYTNTQTPVTLRKDVLVERLKVHRSRQTT